MGSQVKRTTISTHKRILILMIICVIVVFAALSGCSPALDDLVLSGNGAATWFGITPGLTTYSEVFHIMESFPHFDTSNENYPAIEEWNGNTHVTYLLDGIYSTVIFGFDESNLVETISLYLRRIKVEELITLIGEPDYIFTDKYFEHGLGEDKYNSTLLYEKYHVSAFVLLYKPNNQGLTINERTNVHFLTLYNSTESVVEKHHQYMTTNPCLDIDVDSFVYLWNGFGNIFTLYPKIIVHDKNCE